MNTLDASFVLQCLAATAWGSAGLVAVSGPAAAWRRRTLGAGLLAGAIVLGIDGLQTNGLGLPLAALALLPFAVARRFATHLTTISLVVLAAATITALHGLQHAIPAGFTWSGVFGLQPTLLAAGLTFGWLTWREVTTTTSASASHDAHAESICTFGMLATGLGCASMSGSAAIDVAAAAGIVGVLPALERHVHRDGQRLATSIAITVATLFPLALRTTATNAGHELAFAGVTDPLLVTAALLATVAAALLQERHDAETVAAAKLTRRAEPQPDRPADEDPAPREPFSAHDVARELREPLTSILAAADLTGSNRSEKEQQDLQQRLHAFGQQMSDTLTDIEELEALRDGRIELAEEVIDLPRMLQQCVAEAAEHAADREVMVQFDASESLPQFVHGDPARTQQLLARLMQVGSSKCTLGPVHISASVDQQHLHIALLNDHVNAAEEESSSLMFVQQLAEMMGGALQMRERDAGGTEYHLQLPKQLAPDWEVELHELDCGISPTDELIDVTLQGDVLLVTDNADHQTLLGKLMSHTGANVATADSGEVALVLLQQRPFALVLLDMQLPGDDPTATVRSIRANDDSPPIVALSSGHDPASIEASLAAGCNAHLSKPIDEELLRRTLAMHLTAAP